MATAIFGATGRLGELVVESLLERGGIPTDLIAVGRREARLASLRDRGLRTAVAAFGDVDAVSAALEGADRVLLISGSEVGQRIPQHKNVIDAAKAAGVSHLVYTSAPAARTSALVVAAEHKTTEELIEKSGIPATILRNAWYTENYEAEVSRARATGVISNSAGDGRVASATRRDYADAAAVALSSPGHEGRVYELSGDIAWSFSDLASTIEATFHVPVRYVPLTIQEERKALADAGMGADALGFVSGLNGNIRDGLLGVTSGELAALIGRPTEPLAETIRNWR